MNGFERRKEQKKESILRAALDLFAQYGFKKVSLNDIAQKADVSPVTIYNHFGSKSGLVKESIVFLGTEMMDRYRDIIRGEGDFAEKMEAIVFGKVDVASKFSGELGPMLLEESSEYKDFVSEVLMKDAIQITLELFDEGRKQGYISKSISNEAVIAYLEIIRAGIAQSRMLYADKESYPRLVRELNELFLYGVIDTGDRKEFREQKKAGKE
ncbi:MAG: TetR/AcrR family transcriptional regulator [Dehalococcoidales bacterium]|nr:TetR/AcrR family transcriptional regulator [Dehalococcoidales bacterium]